MTRVWGIISQRMTMSEVDRRNPEMFPSRSAITIEMAEFIMAIIKRTTTRI